MNTTLQTPAPPAPIGTEARVCADIAARQAVGIKKYGTTVEGNPLTLRAWLQHAYEETLDQAIYLRRSIEQIDREERLEALRLQGRAAGNMWAHLDGEST